MSENKIVDGVIWKQVLVFFIPLVLSAFFQHFYVMADTFIIGKFLGDTELAAVGGSASKLTTLLINFFIGLSSGITVYVSRYYGAKDSKSLVKCLLNGITLCIGLGVVLMALGIIFSNDLLLLMNTPADTVELANSYLVTFLSGIVFCVLYNAFAGALRALGDSKSPLYVLILCSALNIILDIVLILIFDFNVVGVALATIFAQSVSACILAYVLYKKVMSSTDEEVKPLGKTSFNLSWISPTMLKLILVIGVPAGIQSIMYSLSNIVVQTGINGISTLAVTSWVAYVKIDAIVDIFVVSLGGTVITFVGQNLGAKRLDRVKSSVKQIIFISYIVTGLLVLFFMLTRNFMFSLFTNTPEVVELASSILFYVMPMYLLSIPQQIFSQALRGFGRSFGPMMLTLIGIVGTRLIWVKFIFPLNPTIEFLALCYPIGAVLMSTIFSVYYYIALKKLSV